MSQDAAKNRGLRRGRGSLSKNRAGNWQVRYTDPDGKRRAAGTYRLKGDAEQALARILAGIENNTWKILEDATVDGVDPKTVTLRQASLRYSKGRRNKNGQKLSHYTTAEYSRLVDKVLTPLADRPLRSIRRNDVDTWWSEVSEKTPTQASRAYTHVNSVMRYALDLRLVRENPCRIKYASNYKPTKQPGIPSDGEVALMLQLADEPLRTVIALAVPKEDGAEEILRERLQAIPEHPETLLVSGDPAGKVHWAKSKLNPGWHRVWAVAGYGGRFHSLRAYHLTWFGQRGASLKELQARGGHSTHVMVMQYQRTTGREIDLLRGGR
jgi:hypothetical protein